MEWFILAAVGVAIYLFMNKDKGDTDTSQSNQNITRRSYRSDDDESDTRFITA